MPIRKAAVAAFASVALLAGCHSVATASTTATYRSYYRPGFTQTGLASWYGPRFNGSRTADGERFDMNALTAAHRTLPFNSYVRVTDLAMNRSVVVRINDRGSFGSDRIIDLSARAARALGIKEGGTARVRIELVSATKANASGGQSPVWTSDHR